MKILLLTSNQPNQWGLAHKINSLHPISEIAVVDTTIITSSKKLKKTSLLKNKAKNAVGEIVTFMIFRKCWFGMLKYYSNLFSGFPVEPKIVVNNVNDSKVFELLGDLRPDITIISGTNLLSSNLIRAISLHGRVINLHTGISPYVKGGPNCTNWCFYLGRTDLIGNTIMWLNEGIDSGNIIATERTSFSTRESLLGIHIKVMEHGHDLYLRALRKILHHEEIPNINQDMLSPHRLFLSKDWGVSHRVKALLNYLWMRSILPESICNSETVYPIL